VRFSGGDLIVESETGFQNQVVNKLREGVYVTGSGNIDILENTKVVIDGTDSVATGDGTIDVYVTYEIITL